MGHGNWEYLKTLHPRCLLNLFRRVWNPFPRTLNVYNFWIFKQKPPNFLILYKIYLETIWYITHVFQIWNFSAFNDNVLTFAFSLILAWFCRFWLLRSHFWWVSDIMEKIGPDCRHVLVYIEIKQKSFMNQWPRFLISC